MKTVTKLYENKLGFYALQGAENRTLRPSAAD